MDGRFGDLTRTAVLEFQEAAGLDANGICDATTWSALVEAGFTLGTRLLCFRSPMLRGDDVAELQLRLGSLGFDAGRVDGIFGPRTQHAVGEFQRNAGLVRDEVCGPETIASLLRLQTRGGTASVTGVREREFLRQRAAATDHLRIAVGSDEQSPFLDELASELLRSGRSCEVLAGPWSEQAARTNEFGADLYLGFSAVDTPMVETSYFSSRGYDSDGGRQFAELILAELPVAPGWTVGHARGQRLPILRETRPPAVLLRLGTPEMIAANRDLVIASLVRAIDRWATEPC